MLLQIVVAGSQSFSKSSRGCAPASKSAAALVTALRAQDPILADQLEAMLELHPILSAEQREAVAARLLKAGGKSRG